MSLSEMLAEFQWLQKEVSPPFLKQIVELSEMQDKFQSAVQSAALLEKSIFHEYVAAVTKIEDSFERTSLVSKMALENLRLKRFDYNFEKFYSEGEIKKPVIVDESAKIKRIITDIYQDHGTLHSIEPREFEEVIAELLLSQGYKVELTKQTRDNGYDILAIRHLDFGHAPLKFLVECKRYNKGKVGIEIIRSFREVIETEKANRGILVTTSYFSSQALKKQREHPYLLDFRDKDHVIAWVNDYYQTLSS